MPPAASVEDGEEEMAVPVADPAAEPVAEAEALPSELSEPPLLPMSIVSTMVRMHTSKLGFTLAEGGAIGNNRRGVRAAGLVGAITDTEGEVALVAEACGISGRAAKGGGLGEHVLHALLLEGVSNCSLGWFGGELCFFLGGVN